MGRQLRLIHGDRTHAWAIELQRPGMEPSFAGVFNWTHGLQPCQDGCRTALFRTRAEAREARAGMYYRKGAVVRKVAVEIRCLPERPPKGV